MTTRAAIVILLVASMLFSIINSIVQIFDHSVSKYFPDLNLIWCTDEIYCLHEVGHHVDRLGGYISQTKEFQSSVDKYISTLDDCHGNERVDCWMVDFPGVNNNPLAEGDGVEHNWGGYGEMYANLYAYYRRTGWLPNENFRAFFDYTTIQGEK